MGRRKKRLDALENLLFQLEENVLPMITLSDDVARTKKHIRKVLRLVEAERDDWNARQILKHKPDAEPKQAYNPRVALKWSEREVQIRERTASIPLLMLQAWCKSKDIELVGDFGSDDLQKMLDECDMTSRSWHLGYQEWRTTEHEFVDLTMDEPEKAGGA